MKKPDSFAENKALLPYGDNVGAPAIKVEDITAWKSINAVKVNHYSCLACSINCLTCNLTSLNCISCNSSG